MTITKQREPRSVTVEPGEDAVQCGHCGAVVRKRKNGLPGRHAFGGVSVVGDTEPCPGCKPETAQVATTVTDAYLVPDHMILDGVDTSAGPLYNVSEMAKVFFARSPHWVRWLEAEGRLVLDGVPLVAIRTDSNARKYDLTLIEKIAHALASNHTIDAEQLRQALIVLKVQGEMYGYVQSAEQIAAEEQARLKAQDEAQEEVTQQEHALSAV